MMINKRILKNPSYIGILTLFIIAFLSFSSSAVSAATKTVEPGTSWVVTETTELSNLAIGKGATIEAPQGFSVTMTVDGVETGIKPGTYKGKIIITKAEATPIKYKENMIHQFRQALYLDKSGVVPAKSVLPAAGDYALNNGVLTGAKITSIGENFNGIYVAGGSYTINGAVINFNGNGGNDFAGFGAAIMADGKDTILVLDGVKIDSRGVVRTTIVGNNGSNMIIKNSEISAHDGIQPPDYLPNTQPGYMKNVPWMLGLAGNCRATNLLGNNTTSTYINSSVSAERWGVFSVDDCHNVKLTGINSKISITGDSGYGAYVIGNATDSFYGCEFDVANYAVIQTGGTVNFGASKPEIIARLNTDLKLGLSADELKSIKEKQTTINSRRFGVMCWSPGPVNVMDGTVINSREAIFLVRGSASELNVDGSKGVKLNTENGIIIQVMDLDKAGKNMVNNLPVTTAPYTEPYAGYEDIVKDPNHDLYVASNSDILGNFSNITLKGDFYNGITGGKAASGTGGSPGGGPGAGAPGASSPGAGGPPAGGGPGAVVPGSGGPPNSAPSGGPPSGGGSGSGAPPAGGAPAGGGPSGGGSGAGAPAGSSSTGKNLVLNFKNAKIAGVITSSFAKHAKREFYSDDYNLVGEVTNTPCVAINNGVIVTLDASSVWTVTGESYLTVLNVVDGAVVKAPDGYKLSMTVDGVTTPIKAGNYKGNIILNIII